MKRKYRLVACALVVLVTVCFLWSQLSLDKIKDRPVTFSPDAELKTLIKEETRGMSAEEIRNYSIRKTAVMLSFAARNDLPHREANCVGYAQVCASVCNYAYRVNNLNANAKPVVGYIMLFGANLCDIFKGCMSTTQWQNFFKDHDFVEFHEAGQTIYADACAYDLLLTDCKTVKH